MRLISGTSFVNTEEPCLCLREVELVRPDSKGIHRYLVITVLRGDGPYDFEMDLGPAKEFTASMFYIPTGGQDADTGKYWSAHTTGEALDIANHIREGPFEPPEPPKLIDLVGAYRDQPDKIKKARKGVSTFGYRSVLQRS